MSQTVMNELVNMSQEIIKLKDEKRELLEALKAMVKVVTRTGLESLSEVSDAVSAINKAEAV